MMAISVAAPQSPNSTITESLYSVLVQKTKSDINMTSVEAVIRRVDQVIFNLGDNTTVVSAAVMNKKRKQISSDTAADAAAAAAAAVETIKAPVGLERQYHELLHLLRRGLLGNTTTNSTTGNQNKPSRATRNASALLMGPRGHGKTLVLEECLRQLESEATPVCRFRVVRLHGLLLRGDDVGVAVREITRQIGHIAWNESVLRQQSALSSKTTSALHTHLESFKDILQREASALRMRNTSFHSMLAFLDETLQLAKVDSIPILIVLDELDAFLASSSSSSHSLRTVTPTPHVHRTTTTTKSAQNRPSLPSLFTTTSPSNRQLLLYHLLDRVADHASLISFVGITTRLSTVGMFEKRVKSRAEGTSKVIYLGHLSSYDAWMDALLSKVYIEEEKEEGVDVVVVTKESDTLLLQLKHQLKDMLSLPPTLDKEQQQEKTQSTRLEDKVRRILHRNYQLGKDLRWLSRILSVALSLAVGEFITLYSPGSVQIKSDHCTLMTFTVTPHHILQGIMTMGGSTSALGDLYEDEDNVQSGNASGPSSHMTLSYDTPRLQGLLDLSGAPLAVLLSAKRILSRDIQGNNITPITYERMYKEYVVSFIQSGKCSGADHYDEPIFFKAFIELSQLGFIAPASDHTGGGPLQYNLDQTRVLETMNLLAVKRLPLHINVDVNLELGTALKKGHLMGCTTALRDWGSKTN